MIKGVDFRLYMKELKNSDKLPAALAMSTNGLFGLRPNTQVLATTSDFSVIYKTNSQGLRDKEYDFVKPKNKIRILAFGDSFTFGEGVAYPDRFTDIPEERTPNLEIINFGVFGCGLDQILLKFVVEGLQYSPDYAIIFINKVEVERSSTDIIQNNSVVLQNFSSGYPTGGMATAYISKNDIF